MPNLGGFFSQIIPGAILQAIGTPEQQRAAAEKARAEEEKRREFDLLRAIQREQLAEQRRQTDLRYAPTTVNVPGIGEISGARDIVPALIQAAAAREREVSPEELGALGTIRERIVNPQVGGAADLEAEATKKAFPQFAGETSGLNVDLPQGLRLPRTSVEKMFTEAGQQRKERELEARQNLQRKATARYRELYSTAISGNIPHALADALAIRGATKEFGVAPEYQGLVQAPAERPDQRLSLEDEYLKIKKAKPAGPYTAYEQSVVTQYDAQKAKRERGLTVVDLAMEEAGGDPAKAIAILHRNVQRSQEATERRASFVLEEARRQVTAARSRIDSINQTPEQFDAQVKTRVQRLMQGESPEVQAMVSRMIGLAPPKGGPVASPPGGEQLSRRDPRYKQLQDRKLTDQQIEAQFGVTLVP